SAPPHPEAHDVVDGIADLAIAPVQIRLRREERVIIVLAAVGIVGPCAAAELRKPIVRRAAAIAGIAPDIPVAFAAFLGASALEEPRVPVRRMVWNKIQDDL